MIQIGTVTGRQIAKNKDGDNDVLLLQCTLSSNEDVQTIEYVGQPGEDVNPLNGTAVMIIPISESYKIAIAADDGIVPSMSEGEKKIYSISGGTIAAFINFLESGVLELNGNSDFAVRFNALNTNIQSIITQINANLTLIATEIGGLGGSYTPVPVVEDLTPSKVNEVKII